ncbi:MAG: hypothetical protein R3B82_09365 [Sandaracinaceae bacterium]
MPHATASSRPLQLRVHGWRPLGGIARVAHAELVGPYGFSREVSLSVLTPVGSRAGLRAERAAIARAASAHQHAVLQPVFEVLATTLGDVVLAATLEGPSLDALLASTSIPRSAAYAIVMDLADAAAYLAERGADMVAIEPSDVVLTPDGRVRLVHPALLHAIAGRPFARTEEVGASIVALLRELLVSSGVAAPERALRAVLGAAPSPARLHARLAGHLFAKRCAYERRGIAALVREHARREAGETRVERRSPRTLLAWSA